MRPLRRLRHRDLPPLGRFGKILPGDDAIGIILYADGHHILIFGGDELAVHHLNFCFGLGRSPANDFQVCAGPCCRGSCQTGRRPYRCCCWWQCIVHRRNGRGCKRLPLRSPGDSPGTYASPLRQEKFLPKVGGAHTGGCQPNPGRPSPFRSTRRARRIPAPWT